MKKLTALFVISCQQVVFGAPEPDRTLRSMSEALFSRSAVFLRFSCSSFMAKEIDAHSYIAPDRRNIFSFVLFHNKQ